MARVADEKNTTDAELVKRIIDGDAELFGELMQRYEAKLLRYVVYLTHDEPAASDVVQETFIRTYQNLRGYNDAYKFSSWIFRIAHNQAMNMLKRYARETGLENINEPSAESTTVRDIDREILRDDMTECMNDLEPRYREVLMLQYIEHMKYSDIADVVHAPPSTVGVWAKRARERLREICKNKGVTP